MRQGQRGFALFVVLMALGFLALLGTQIVSAGRTQTRLVDNLRQAAELEAAAQGAIAHAMWGFGAAHDPAFRPGPAERRISVGGIPVLVKVQNENDRINLNTCSIALMQALLVQLRVPPLEAAHLAAAILDWRTGGDQARPNGAKTQQYEAAGRPYGPPGSPFQSIDELRDVLGMTPALFAALAPHVTVLTDTDPDLSTQDPVVAQALIDAAGSADGSAVAPASDPDAVLRITATALGADAGRYTIVAVATSDFRGNNPTVHILFLARCTPSGLAGAACS